MWTYSVRIGWDGVSKYEEEELDGGVKRPKEGAGYRPWKDSCMLVKRRWACRSENK